MANTYGTTDTRKETPRRTGTGTDRRRERGDTLDRTDGLTDDRTGSPGTSNLSSRTGDGGTRGATLAETPRGTSTPSGTSTPRPTTVTAGDRIPEGRHETKTAQPQRGDGDDNPDPITGTPGSHPLGTGVGAAGGGAAGAAMGAAVGGPVGALVGGAVGAIAGGAAGHGVAERIDPTVEDTYWRDTWRHRDYTKTERYSYDEDYRPAYRYGWESRSRHDGRSWDDNLETELATGWNEARGTSRLSWDEARPATRDAWSRLDDRSRTGDEQDVYWRENWQGRNYVRTDSTYDDYGPAFRYGWESRGRHGDRDWNDRTEEELGRGWDKARGRSRLSWDDARHAARDAWHRMERRLPGDADRDGR